MNPEPDRPFYPIDSTDPAAPWDGTWIEGKYRWHNNDEQHFKFKWEGGLWRDENYSIRNPHLWRPLPPTPDTAANKTFQPGWENRYWDLWMMGELHDEIARDLESELGLEFVKPEDQQ